MDDVADIEQDHTILVLDNVLFVRDRNEAHVFEDDAEPLADEPMDSFFGEE